jgi:hypothetical protein
MVLRFHCTSEGREPAPTFPEILNLMKTPQLFSQICRAGNRLAKVSNMAHDGLE